MQALINAYNGTDGLVIRYTGQFDFSKITDACTQWKVSAGAIVEIKNKSNITIEGATGSGANFGIAIKADVSNVIVRNMTIGLLPGSIDAIGIEGQGGPDRLDRQLHQRPLHHVPPQLLQQRRLARAAAAGRLHPHLQQPFLQPRHLGANIRMQGYSLIESNYFENSKNPVTSRDSSQIGYWELRNNNILSPADFSKYGITWVASDSKPTKDASDWTTTATFPVGIPYSYTSDPAACIKAKLPAAAGAGTQLAKITCP